MAARARRHTGSRLMPSDARARGFEPLRITAHMTAPIVATEPIHLDSILVATAVRRCGYLAPDSRYHEVGFEPSDDECPRLPLAREEHNSRWWYRCSAWWPAVQTECVRQAQPFGKKWAHDHEDLLDTSKARTVTLTNAKFKEAWIPLQTIMVRTVEWYAVGNRKRVHDIARRISHIGRKGSQGYGLVSRVETTALRDEDPEEWALDAVRPDGGPARNVPVSWARERGINVRSETVAPLVHPYWRRREANVAEVAR